MCRPLIDKPVGAKTQSLPSYVNTFRAKEFSRSRWRLGDHFQVSFCIVSPTRPSIATALMPFEAFSGHGWFFSFCRPGPRAG